MSIEAMKLARAIEYLSELDNVPSEIIHDLQAIEQAQKQEPVAWANRVIGGRKWLSIHASKEASDRWLEYRIKEQAQGEEYEQISLYTSPPQRQWVGLTDEERKDLCRWWSSPMDAIYATEAKLKEKNGL